ncbi:MAG: DNA primase, partial [Parcubacteria group bacterium]
GVNFKALCPFHQEKTPSFMVSPERRSWHCFGCAKGGDIFSFVMEIEGLDFREALKLLARKAGVELPTSSQAKQHASRASRLFAVNEAARDFFVQQLVAPSPEHKNAARIAQQELARRKVDQLTRETFGIGFAPASWEALSSYLLKKGFGEQDLVAAGVTVARPAPKPGGYDRFRNRLTFPLTDVVGRVVGFSARALDPAEKMGKYINSPESEVYHKGKFLFALGQAKSEIRRRGFAILVEGQMDAISSHRVGVRNVVATSGTALTLQQLELLKRYTTNLILAFDVDLAGSSATKRGIDLAITSGFNVKVARMPEGVDPDDLCRSDPKIWASALNQCEAIVEYYLRKSTTGRDLAKVENKKVVAHMVLPEVARLIDPVEQAHYLQRLSQLLGMDESVLRQALKHTVADSSAKMPAAEVSARAATQSVDSLTRKLARLIALRVRGSPLSEADLGPLTILDNSTIQRVHELLRGAYQEGVLFTEVNKLDPELGRLANAEAFALDRESQRQDNTEQTPDEALRQEVQTLVKVITREGLRRELADLHRTSVTAHGPQAQELATRFVQKTQELAKLEAQAPA